jgi:RimJ/RimL family protein N-acetyltransferase
MKSILKTERLILRELVLNDAPFIIELLNTDGWLRFIGDKAVRTIDHAEKYLTNGPLKSYAQNGFGLYLVERKEDQKPIGMCGLLKRENLNMPDIGFAFLPQYSGMGYAYESASATVKYAKVVLNIAELCAITISNNTRSIQLLERVGFIYSKKIQVEKEELSLYMRIVHE